MVELLTEEVVEIDSRDGPDGRFWLGRYLGIFAQRPEKYNPGVRRVLRP